MFKSSIKFEKIVYVSDPSLMHTCMHGGGIFILVKMTSPHVPHLRLAVTLPMNYMHGYVFITTLMETYIRTIGSFYCPPHSPVKILDELVGSLSYIQTIYSSAKQFRETFITFTNEFMLAI